MTKSKIHQHVLTDPEWRQRNLRGSTLMWSSLRRFVYSAAWSSVDWHPAIGTLAIIDNDDKVMLIWIEPWSWSLQSLAVIALSTAETLLLPFDYFIYPSKPFYKAEIYISSRSNRAYVDCFTMSSKSNPRKSKTSQDADSDESKSSSVSSKPSSNPKKPRRRRSGDISTSTTNEPSSASADIGASHPRALSVAASEADPTVPAAEKKPRRAGFREQFLQKVRDAVRCSHHISIQPNTHLSPRWHLSLT